MPWKCMYRSGISKVEWKTGVTANEITTHLQQFTTQSLMW